MTVADPQPVTVLVADGDALARLGLRTLLRPVPEISVVAETADASALPELIAAWAPDVLIADQAFGAGLATAPRVRGREDEPCLVVMAAGPGRSGGPHPAAPESRVVAKSAPPVEILEAIAAVAGREPPRPIRPSGLDALTPRESEVLGLVARGLTNDEIHELLDLSLETVRTHLKHIYSKCGVTDRTHAVIAAYHGGLVSIP